MHNERQTFEIEGCIGKGGYGEIYRATMISSGGLRKRVAIKTLLAEVAPESNALSRLRDEARLLSSLNHRSILTVFDLLVLHGRVALVMEYVDGQDLSVLSQGPTPIPYPALLNILGEVADALDAAYNAPLGVGGQPLRIVHRDIKPSNIRVDPHATVKLLDFGIARSPQVEREAKTGRGLLVGTIGYLSPDRFEDEELDTRSDVYSLGCILYETITGRRLFHDMPNNQILQVLIDPAKYQSHVAESLASLPHETPDSIRDILENTLTFSRKHRMHAAEMSNLCEDVAAQLPGLSLRQWCRQRKWEDVPLFPSNWSGQVLSSEAVEFSRDVLSQSVSSLLASDELEDYRFVDKTANLIAPVAKEVPRLIPPPTPGFAEQDPSSPSDKASAPAQGSEETASGRSNKRQRATLSAESTASSTARLAKKQKLLSHLRWAVLGGCLGLVVLGLVAVGVGASVIAYLHLNRSAEVEALDQPAVTANGLATRSQGDDNETTTGSGAPGPDPAANPSDTDAPDLGEASTDDPTGDNGSKPTHPAPAPRRHPAPARTQPTRRSSTSLPPEIDAKVTTDSRVRANNVATFAGKKTVTTALIKVLKTDPSPAVRQTAFRVVHQNYVKELGSRAAHERAMVWASANLPISKGKQAITSLCEHSASIRNLDVVLNAAVPSLRSHLIAQCQATWVTQNPSKVSELQSVYERRLNVESNSQVKSDLRKAIRELKKQMKSR